MRWDFSVMVTVTLEVELLQNLSQISVDSHFQLDGFEIIRAQTAGIHDTAVQSNQVQARRPGSIGCVDVIVHFIYVGLNAVLQCRLAFPSHRPASVADEVWVWDAGKNRCQGQFCGRMILPLGLFEPAPSLEQM